MLFFKFYGSVFREAFRHSPDLTQAIIFVVIALGGLIAARNPAMKPLIDSLDLGGYQIAAFVFGGIIAVRVILAPCWLWRDATARNTIAPERSIDYKLTVSAISSWHDKRERPRVHRPCPSQSQQNQHGVDRHRQSQSVPPEGVHVSPFG